MNNEKKLVPKLRFPEFTHAWEQRKLGDLGNTFTGLSGKTKEDFGHGDAKFITYLNVFNNSISDLNGTEQIEIDPKQNSVEYGDILFTTSSETPNEVGMSSVWLGNAENVYLNSFCFGYRLNQKMDLHFLAFLLRSPEIRQKFTLLAQGISRYNISKTKVMEMSIFVPEIEEQQKIGTFFTALDRYITIHQRKLENVKKLKAGLLQKMFPKNDQEFPEIRFPEFTYAWEQRKLGDLVQRVVRKNKNLESTLPLTISAQYGLVDQNEFFNKVIASKDVSGYYLIEKGEFAYNKSYSNGFPWGAIKRLDLYPKGVLSTLYILFKPTNVNSDFLTKYYETTRWHSEISRHAAEGARNHGLLNIATEDFFKTKLTIPKLDEEQQKIGAFFTALDRYITIHQRKLENMQKLKKSLLQQMFV